MSTSNGARAVLQALCLVAVVVAATPPAAADPCGPGAVAFHSDPGDLEEGDSAVDVACTAAAGLGFAASAGAAGAEAGFADATAPAECSWTGFRTAAAPLDDGDPFMDAHVGFYEKGNKAAGTRVVASSCASAAGDTGQPARIVIDHISAGAWGPVIVTHGTDGASAAVLGKGSAGDVDGGHSCAYGAAPVAAKTLPVPHGVARCVRTL